MTDKFHYQDVFQTINIPENERTLALKAKNLFDVILDTDGDVDTWNSAVHLHLQKITDSESASQAFWEFEDDTNHLYDRLVLSIMKRGLIVALEHRDFDDRDAAIRQSLMISNGVSKVYTSNLRRRGVPDNGSTSELVIADFKRSLLDTTANLGLYHRIQEVRQNESDSAILASAA
ncbi:MAG: hypothetical protein JWN12_481 [Candidatus Saccharibacteria bacterium]|nr:hypothetical protein [Candidatus Saccharibacteria bacterium]